MLLSFLAKQMLTLWTARKASESLIIFNELLSYEQSEIENSSDGKFSLLNPIAETT